MKERSSEPECQTQSRKSLLRRYDIPIDHLDFKYLETCTNAREVERILKILRSGEEGHYSELEEFAESKLKQLDPNNRVLRVQLPVLRSESLGTVELKALEEQFLAWTTNYEDLGDGDYHRKQSKAIFDSDADLEVQPEKAQVQDCGSTPPPIRFTKLEDDEETGKLTTATTSSKAQNPARIKSWDYDKWEKFDVDAELTKLEVGALKQAEFDLSGHRKQLLKEQQQVIEKLMKNEDPEDINILLPKQASRRLNAKNNANRSPIYSETSSSAKRVADRAEDSDVPLLEDCESLIRPTCSRKLERLEVNDESSLEKSLVVANDFNDCFFKQNKASTSSRVSFIEEIPQERHKIHVPEENQKKKGNEKTKRRFKIQIEDLNRSETVNERKRVIEYGEEHKANCMREIRPRAFKDVMENATHLDTLQQCLQCAGSAN